MGVSSALLLGVLVGLSSVRADEAAPMIQLRRLSEHGSSSGSGSGSAHPATPVNNADSDCGGCNRDPNFACRDHGRDYILAYYASYNFSADFAGECRRVCPGASSLRQFSCEEHWHDTLTQFDDGQEVTNGLQWTIYFLALSLILSSANKLLFPSWLPFTVGLLVQGIVLGIIAQALFDRASCPAHALKSQYNTNHDHKISRTGARSAL